MTLTVEKIGAGPRHLPTLSMCHYGEQNREAMRAPGMCFEMEIEDGRLTEVYPYYCTNEYAGTEESRRTRRPGSSTPVPSKRLELL